MGKIISSLRFLQRNVSAVERTLVEGFKPAARLSSRSFYFIENKVRKNKF